MYRILVLSFICCLSVHSRATVIPNSLFSNNMVLQQGVAVPIWGRAADNEIVTVSFLDQKVTTTAKNGKWFIKLSPLKAGGPFEMIITGSNKVKIENVLVGEVWLCGGQSNMARKLGVQAFQPDILERQSTVDDAVNYLQIRQFFVPLKASSHTFEDVNGSWAVGDSNAIKDFTAVGYFFAKALTQKLNNVPIGLISSSWGGTAAQKWTSRAALESNNDLKYLVAAYDKSILTFPEDLASYKLNEDSILNKWKIEAEAARKNGEVASPKPKAPIPPEVSGDCGGLYNAMIAPLMPYAIKGVIWYQGEADQFKAKQYQTLFPAMISDWRKQWNIGNFPFLYVQVAPFNRMKPEIRESQLLCLKTSVNTAMAVTVDCGDANKIHPGNKKPVGERLALAAEALAYNQKVAYSGPIYSSMVVRENTIVLSFAHVNKGLMVKGDTLTDFVIAGADKKFVPAKAIINGDKIVVYSDSVSNPVAVRMGWSNVPKVTLFNKDGLPASPFRTDYELVNPNLNKNRPNIIFILSDDHAKTAISAYGGLNAALAPTPNIDRIASGGAIFNNMLCTNAICGPSRASLLTGKYSTTNGFYQNEGGVVFDSTQATTATLLHASGYNTALIGKWHLFSTPVGFDYFKYHISQAEQGEYWDPYFDDNGIKKQEKGYSSNIEAKLALQWMSNDRDKSKPFMLMLHFKAPHRPWKPDTIYQHLFDDVQFPYPSTFNDTYLGREQTAGQSMAMIEKHLSRADLKQTPPPNLSGKEKAEWLQYGATGDNQFWTPNDSLKGQALKNWKFQNYIKDYLRCVRSVDDNVGLVLDYLKDNGLEKNTIVVYMGDQGFYLGEHGWFDKRWMYEESLQMPCLIRFPDNIKAGGSFNQLALNVDIAPTLLDYAGVAIPNDIQGKSLKPILEKNSEAEKTWRKSAYYQYFEYPKWHRVQPHYGVRTDRYKLIHFYYNIDVWEFYDLKKDAHELKNQYKNPAYQRIIANLKLELKQLQKQYNDDISLEARRKLTDKYSVKYAH